MKCPFVWSEIFLIAPPNPLAEQKRMQSKAEGDARADGVETYSEVSARPDNEVMRRLCPRGLAEQKRMQSEAHRSRGAKAYLMYVEVTCEKQRRYAPFMPAKGEIFPTSRGLHSPAD